VAQQLGERIDEINNFGKTKEMVCKLKRPSTEWEKIFASYIHCKGLITKIYEELKKLKSQKINDPMKKWVLKGRSLNG
jgi:hypothetical protein